MSFNKFSEIDRSVSMHHGNIQVLAIELCKIVNGLCLKLFSDCFKLSNMTVYDTRNWYTFYSRQVYTVLHGKEPLSHSGPKIKKIVPNVMKNLSTLTAFENTMKFWKP